MASQPAPMIGRNAALAGQWEQWLGDHGRSSPHVVLISGPAGSGRRTLATRIARDLNPHWDLSEALDAMGAASDAVIAHFRREIGWIRSQRYTALGQSVAGMTGLAPAITLLDVLGKAVEIGAQLSEDRRGGEPVPIGVLIDWDADAKGAERLSKWLELHAHGRMQFWLVVVVSSDLNTPSAFDRYLHEALDPEIPTSPSLCLRTSPWWDRAASDTYAAVRLQSQNIADGVLAALWAGAVAPDAPPEKRASGRVVALLNRWVARGAVVEERGRWQLARRPGVSGWFGRRLPSPGWDELVGDLAGDLAQEAALVLAAWGATPDEGVERMRRIRVPLGALEAAVSVEAVAAMLPQGLQPRDGGPTYWHVQDGALIWADPLVALALAEKAHVEASIRGGAVRQTVDALLWIAERPWSERQRWADAEAAWRKQANLRLEELPDLGTGEHDDALAYLDWLRWGARLDQRTIGRLIEHLDERFVRARAHGLRERLWLLALETIMPMKDSLYSMVIHHVAIAIADQGRLTEAEALLLRLLEEKLRAKDHLTSVGVCRHELGRVISMQGRHLEAEALLQKALSDKMLGGDNLASVGLTRHVLAHIIINLGRYTESEALLREALDEKVRGRATIVSVAITRHELGRVIALQGRHGEAEFLVRQALDEREYGGADIAMVGQCRYTLGRVVAEQGRHQEAEALQRQALDEQLRGGADLLSIGDTRRELGRVVSEQGRHGEAEGLLREALDEKLRGDVDLLSVSSARCTLSHAVAFQGRHRDAEGLLREALDEKLRGGADLLSIGHTRYELGRVVSEQGRHGEAEGLLREALDEKLRGGADLVWIAFTRAHLARVIGALGQTDRARAEAEAARTDLEKRWAKIASWPDCLAQLRCAGELQAIAEILSDSDARARWQLEVQRLTAALNQTPT